MNPTGSQPVNSSQTQRSSPRSPNNHHNARHTRASQTSPTPDSQPAVHSRSSLLPAEPAFVHEHQPQLTLCITHINLARKHDAAAELINSHSNLTNVIFSINEPPFNHNRIRGLTNFSHLTNSHKSNERIGAVIAGSGPNITLCQVTDLSSANCVTAEITFHSFSFIMVSIYMAPSIPIENSLAEIEPILERFADRPILICSDTNARHYVWYDHESNARGKLLDRFIQSRSLLVANTNPDCTFVNSSGSSVIDLMVCNSPMFRKMGECRTVLSPSSLSDHRYVKSTISLVSGHRTIEHRTTTRKFKTKGVNWSSFCASLKEQLSERNLNPYCTNRKEADEYLNDFYDALTTTCNTNLKKQKTKSLKNSTWFDSDCEASRKSVARACHRYQSSSTDTMRAHYRAVYQRLRNEHKRLIQSKKTSSWRKYCTETTNDNMFERLRITKAQPKAPLSTITKQNGQQTTGFCDTVVALLEAHFPNDLSKLTDSNPSPLTPLQQSEVDPIGEDELAYYISRMRARSAPGRDGICSMIIKSSSATLLPILTPFYSSLLHIGYFPNRWKTGIACFLPKPNATQGTAKSRRPITLIHDLAKLLERPIGNRLVRFLYETGQMSLRQFGFVKQKSTEQAVCGLIEHIRHNRLRRKYTAVVALDIAGAFDSADWSVIINALKTKNVPQYLVNMISSYFNHRFIKTLDPRVPGRPLTQGCPQGSSLGPILWNVLMDEILTSPLLSDVFTQAFADDLVACLDSDHLSEEFKAKCADRIAAIYRLGKSLKLTFNESKTQVMIFGRTGRSASPAVELLINGKSLQTKDELTYLGVCLDNQLNFNKHLNAKIIRAESQLNYLRRAAAADWGLSPEITRILYTSAIEPILLYCSSAFVHRLNTKNFTKKLRALQRKCCLAITKAWPTCRTETVIALAGLQPIDIKAKIRHAISQVKASGSLEGSPIEREQHWLSKITLWNWRAIKLAAPDETAVHDYRIFTDGSKTELGVGLGVAIYSGESDIAQRSLSERLPDHCSVYQAELTAIKTALEILAEMQPANVTILICTDSLSALQSIQNKDRQYLIAAEIRGLVAGLLDNHNTAVTFQWVRGHSGVLGNEEADALARAGVELDEISRDLPAPLSDAALKLRNSLLSDWTLALPELTGEWSRRFVTIHNISLLVDRHTTQFMTGHGLFNAHRHRMGLAASGECGLCGDPSDTPLHALFKCPALASLRSATLEAVGISRANDLAKLKDRETHVPFRRFCASHSERKKYAIFSANRPA